MRSLVECTIAGYGTFIVGQIAQVYLEQGCTGYLSPSPLIADILSQAEPKTIIYLFIISVKHDFSNTATTEIT